MLSFFLIICSSSEKKAEDPEPTVAEEETSEEEPKDEVCFGVQQIFGSSCLLIHIHQKRKIALEIMAEVSSVNRPLIKEFLFMTGREC
jgi:hypothetical protein